MILIENIPFEELMDERKTTQLEFETIFFII